MGVLELWMFLYPILCVAVPCVLYHVIASKKGDRQEPIPVKHRIWSFIFVLYLFLVLEVTGIGSVWEIGKYGTVIRLEEINWIPFQSDGMMTYVLNVILFLPLGFLLPLIWQNYRTLLPTAITGAAFSMAIEVGQLFNRRQTDIDDLMMNLLGTIIGFGLWLVFCNVFHVKQKQSPGLGQREAAMYIALSVMARFFLYNWRFFLAFVE